MLEMPEHLDKLEPYDTRIKGLYKYIVYKEAREHYMNGELDKARELLDELRDK